jgi:hypothetical protein
MNHGKKNPACLNNIMKRLNTPPLLKFSYRGEALLKNNASVSLFFANLVQILKFTTKDKQPELRKKTICSKQRAQQMIF